MAGCCGGASGVVIMGGDNIIVSGSGTVSDPYVVSGSLEVILQAKDTNTIQMDLVGTGTTDDPFVLSATSLIGVNDLVDVIDPTPPILNDTLLFDGTKWVYGPAASVPAGSINVDPGLTGDGTVGDPLAISVSETVETSTSGLYTYIDSAGELRAEVRAAGSVAWTSVTGKPTTFAPTRPLTADSVVNAFTPSAIGVPGIRIWVGPTTPVGAVDDDIWFQTP